MTPLESEEFYNNLKAEGMTDAEIAESFIWSIKLTPEEEKIESDKFRKFIKDHKASKPLYKRLYRSIIKNYLSTKYKLQDRWK